MAKRAKTKGKSAKPATKKKAPPTSPPPSKKKKAVKKRKAKSVSKALASHPPAVHRPDRAETQTLVWGAFANLRSAAAVAAQTGVSEWIVRQVLHADRDRLLTMIDQFMEGLVAEWENQQIRSHRIMADLLGICEAMVDEIKLAAKEGRATRILDREGFPMPVLDAMQFLVMSRLLDQVGKLAAQAQSISSAYRQGEQARTKDKEAAKTDVYDFDTMSDVQIAQVIRAAGLKLPPILEYRVKMIESQSKQV